MAEHIPENVKQFLLKDPKILARAQAIVDGNQYCCVCQTPVESKRKIRLDRYGYDYDVDPSSCLGCHRWVCLEHSKSAYNDHHDDRRVIERLCHECTS